MSFRTLLFYALLFVAGVCVAGIVSKMKAKKKTESTRASLPSLFDFGVPPAAVAERSERGAVIMYLHPECDYCQHEMEDLRDHLRQLDGVAVVVISAGDRPATERLLQDNNLVADRDILLGYDEQDRFYELFGTRSIPSTLVYDDRGHLQKAYQGEVSIAILLQQLNHD